jgi:radical SAM superfamily enzyme YgiQ (UPF0313 family)
MDKVWILYGRKGHQIVALTRPPQGKRGFYLAERKGERNLRFLLGYVSISNYLTAEDGWIWDEPVEVELKKVRECFKGVSIVGISSHFDDYQNGLLVARAAKAAGAKTVLGGPYPSNCAELIVKLRGDIFDYVVKGPGEIPFLEITRGKIFSSKVIDGTINRLPLNLLPRMVRKSWSVGGTPEKPSSLVRWSEGCPRALGKKTCSFCCILHAECSSHRTIEQIVDETKQLYELGCRWVEIVDDDVVGILGKKNIRRLVEEVEAGRCPRMDIYIHAGMRSIHDLETLKLLKRLGVVVIQTGFETADLNLKKKNADKATIKEEDEFIERCAKLKIALHPSLIAGFAGETWETMAATFARAAEIGKKVPVYGISVDPIVILPGCADYLKLVGAFPKFGEMDILDVEAVTRVWFKSFTSVTLEEVIELYSQTIPKIPAQAVVGWHLRNPGNQP